MKRIFAISLTTALIGGAAPLIAQPTFSGTPTGTVHQSSRQTQSDPTTTARQKKRLAEHRAKVKRADAAARKATQPKAEPKR